MRGLCLLASLAACTPAARVAPATTAPTEGITIALYQTPARGYGVVDDRRTVDVRGGAILLDRIEPGAALQSLVIEPLGEPGTLRVLGCVRERIDDSVEALAQLAEARSERPRRVIVLHDLHDPAPERFHLEDGKGMEPAVVPDPSVLSPLVRCRVAARDGKHLVRVLHVAGSFAFQARHDLVIAEPARAVVTTRFAFTTPAWLGRRATLTLFDGLPGDDAAPRVLATAPAVLDGSTTIISGAPREIAAQLRVVYSGIALEDSEDVKPNDIVWGRASHHRVWQWLELAAALAPGPIRAHVELAGVARDLEIESTAIERDEATRIPLWIDEDLLGTRTRSVDRADGVTITDRLQLSVSNLGDAPREVWVEEQLRAKPRRFVLAQRKRPQLVGERLRLKLTIAPGKTEHIGFTVDYDLRE